MMAAYQPQPAMHPGMAPHGHPAMTPGGQPMPHQMQQMGHPGVSGPGQPHVTQPGAMMGMQPGGMGGQPPGSGMAGAQMGGMPGQMGGQSMAGGMPNAQAMNHLNPQAHMQQQQMMQQQLAQNPQLAMARQQQIMHQRAMQAQIQASGGIPQGMQQGIQGMTPQQLQQMQQNNPAMHPGQVQLTSHLMQQQQQLHLQRQAQVHAQQQNQLQQQQLAMQQQGSQHSNPGGQPGPPNQQAAQGQQPAQMRPQSRMANPNEQNQSAGQNTPQAQPGQPQTQQNQAGGQPQNPQQPGQQPQMTQQQQMMMQQRQQMMRMQQQQNMARQSMAQPQVNINGQAILFFLNMCDYLCQFGRHNGMDIDLWRMFVDKHFAADAELVHAFSAGNEGQSKEFRVLRPSIARYFNQYFASGAESIRIHTEYVKEERIPPTNRLRMTSGAATLRVMYENGARLEMKGTITADFGTGMIPEAIEQLTFWTSASEEVIGRNEIEKLLQTFSPTMSTKASPKMAKKNPPKGQQKGSQYDALTIDHFPKARRGAYGGPEQVQTFLELGETFNVMADLMAFAQEKKLRPDSALEAINQQYAKEGPPGGDPNQQGVPGNPQLNLPPNGIPMANRTPSMQSMNNPQFSSPAMQNMNLPMQPNGIPMNGSPHISNTPGLQPGGMQAGHTPSPGHQNMQAPAMLPQHSQQGTNSSAASANTSPNVNNKRRRSTVKTEDDGVGGMKPSPNVRKKGKPGA